MLDKYKEIDERLMSTRNYRQLSSLTTILGEEGVIENNIVKKKWEKIIQDPLMIKTNEPASFEDNNYYHFIYIVYYIINEDKKSTFKHDNEPIYISKDNNDEDSG